MIKRLTCQCSPLGSVPPTAWPKGTHDEWRTGGGANTEDGKEKEKKIKKNEKRGEKTEGKVNRNKQETFIFTTKR